MKIFETVNDYLKEFKPNDIIVLGGNGLMDGIKSLKSKHDTHKVHKNTTKDNIVITEYRGRKRYVLGASGYSQQVALLTKEEFKDLPTLW